MNNLFILLLTIILFTNNIINSAQIAFFDYKTCPGYPIEPSDGPTTMQPCFKCFPNGDNKSQKILCKPFATHNFLSLHYDTPDCSGQPTEQRRLNEGHECTPFVDYSSSCPGNCDPNKKENDPCNQGSGCSSFCCPQERIIPDYVELVMIDSNTLLEASQFQDPNDTNCEYSSSGSLTINSGSCIGMGGDGDNGGDKGGNYTECNNGCDANAPNTPCLNQNCASECCGPWIQNKCTGPCYLQPPASNFLDNCFESGCREIYNVFFSGGGGTTCDGECHVNSTATPCGNQNCDNDCCGPWLANTCTGPCGFDPPDPNYHQVCSIQGCIETYDYLIQQNNNGTSATCDGECHVNSTTTPCGNQNCDNDCCDPWVDNTCTGPCGFNPPDPNYHQVCSNQGCRDVYDYWNQQSNNSESSGGGEANYTCEGSCDISSSPCLGIHQGNGCDDNCCENWVIGGGCSNDPVCNPIPGEGGDPCSNLGTCSQDCCDVQSYFGAQGRRRELISDIIHRKLDENKTMTYVKMSCNQQKQYTIEFFENDECTGQALGSIPDQPDGTCTNLDISGQGVMLGSINCSVPAIPIPPPVNPPQPVLSDPVNNKLYGRMGIFHDGTCVGAPDKVEKAFACDICLPTSSMESTQFNCSSLVMSKTLNSLDCGATKIEPEQTMFTETGKVIEVCGDHYSSQGNPIGFSFPVFDEVPKNSQDYAFVLSFENYGGDGCYIDNYNQLHTVKNMECTKIDDFDSQQYPVVKSSKIDCAAGELHFWDLAGNGDCSGPANRTISFVEDQCIETSPGSSWINVQCTGPFIVPEIRTKEPTAVPSMAPSHTPTTKSPLAGDSTHSPVTGSPSLSPSKMPTTNMPSKAPSSSPRTAAPNTNSPSASPDTQTPTIDGETFAPTNSPTSKSPTSSPTTPTFSPTDAVPNLFGSCWDKFDQAGCEATIPNAYYGNSNPNGAVDQCTSCEWYSNTWYKAHFDLSINDFNTTAQWDDALYYQLACFWGFQEAIQEIAGTRNIWVGSDPAQLTNTFGTIKVRFYVSGHISASSEQMDAIKEALDTNAERQAFIDAAATKISTDFPQVPMIEASIIPGTIDYEAQTNEFCGCPGIFGSDVGSNSYVQHGVTMTNLLAASATAYAIGR